MKSTFHVLRDPTNNSFNIYLDFLYQFTCHINHYPQPSTNYSLWHFPKSRSHSLLFFLSLSHYSHSSFHFTILNHHFISLFSIIISFHYSQSSFHFSSSIIVLGDQQSFLRLPLMYMTINICSLFLDSVTLQQKYSYSLVNHKFVNCWWEVAVILSDCMSPCSDSQMEKERLWRYRLGGCFLSIIVACFFSFRFSGWTNWWQSLIFFQITFRMRHR